MTRALQNAIQPLVEAITQSFSLNGGIWIGITLFFYIISVWVYRKAKCQPLLHPLIITAVATGCVLVVTHTDVERYQAGARILHWMLGPATVALAVPMYNQWDRIRHLGGPLVMSIAVGGLIAPVLAWGMVFGLDAPIAIQLTMLVKSITSPLAMETSAILGGIPALAAVFVIVTGIVGALITPLIYSLLNVTSAEAQGIALGTVCHAAGTARALELGEIQGALATVGLCVNGLITATLLPLLFSL